MHVHKWMGRLSKRLGISHTGPVFYRLLASFLAMLLLPLATLLFNYIYARGLLRQENLNYQNALLVQAQMIVDEKLQGLQLFAQDMSSDGVISGFLTSDDLTGNELQMTLWELSRHLQSYSASYRELCEPYFYSIHYDCLVGVNSADSRVTEQVIRMESDVLNEQLQQLLFQPRQFCRYATLRDGVDSELVMVHSVPLWSTGRAADGTICLVIDTEGVFRNIAEMEELQAGLVCLLDENGKVIISAGDDTLLAQLPEAAALGEGLLEKKAARYTVSTANSALNDWQYISIQPEHAVIPRLVFIRNLSLGIFALLLLLGVGAAWILSRHNYRPVENLMDVLRQQSGVLREQTDSGESEFSLIERSVNDITESMGAVRILLQDELPRIQEGMLLQLLRNAVTDYETFEKTLSEMGILLPYRMYAVAVIRQSGPNSVNFEEQAIVNVIAKEQLVKLMPSMIAYATVGVQSDMLVVILNSNVEDFEKQVVNALQTLEDRLRSEFSRMVTIHLSRVVSSIERVPHAYYTASQTQAARPTGVIQLSQQPPARVEQGVEEVAAPLKNYIATGDSEKALALLQARYRHGIKGNALAVHTLRGYYASLLNLISSAYTQEDDPLLMPDGSDPMALLFVQRTAAEMEQTVEIVVTHLCALVKENQKSHAVQLTEQILDFLQLEYANSELTLSYVADRFYITSSYLSAFFKENVGDTFLNYLTRLRIDHAKKLICTTNLPMGVIAVQVGYASGNTFTRIFKKAEGITPSQYRESSLK
ncbi:MAG: AraC family transcriptional regulator [Clostridiales bacterium]|nr:AraC family transcriptional regulator [Clostridiales bacterium]